MNDEDIMSEVRNAIAMLDNGDIDGCRSELVNIIEGLLGMDK